MAPSKGGPSAGTGLHATPDNDVDRTAASPASIAAALGNAGVAVQPASTDAAAAIGTASSAVLSAPLIKSLTTHTHNVNPNAARLVATDAANQGAVESTPEAGSSAAGEALASAADARTASATKVTADASDVAATSTATNTTVTSDDVKVLDLNDEASLKADYLDMAPVSDAVKVQPTFSPFAMSAASIAYAKFLRDSIRNSLMDPHGIQFGGIAGLNWSGASASASSTGKVSGTPLAGFTLGAFADIPLKKNLSFRPGLLYSNEGYQANVQGNRTDIHVAFMSMPLDIVYHSNWLGRRFFFGAGPYAAYAMNGTYTFKGINSDMQFGNNYNNGDNLRHIDMGVNVMAGLLLDRNFVLGAKFDMGLSNIAPDGAGATVHTRSAGLSIAYVFRNKANTKTY
jgi:hypothetical protein